MYTPSSVWSITMTKVGCSTTTLMVSIRSSSLTMRDCSHHGSFTRTEGDVWGTVSLTVIRGLPAILLRTVEGVPRLFIEDLIRVFWEDFILLFAFAWVSLLWLLPPPIWVE